MKKSKMQVRSPSIDEEYFIDKKKLQKNVFVYASSCRIVTNKLHTQNSKNIRQAHKNWVSIQKYTETSSYFT